MDADIRSFCGMELALLVLNPAVVTPRALTGGDLSPVDGAL